MDLDVLVVGSGVAGLSAAISAARDGLSVGVLTKAQLLDSATRWAQGGVASVLGDPDSPDLHLADTLAAGDGVCDEEAVRVLVDEGPGRLRELIALGAVFDRDHDGALALAREGGHSMARIVHAGGAATGAEIERALCEAVRSTAAVVLEGWFALDLVVAGDRCAGVVALDPDGARREVRADHVVLASGGAGQLFAVTTNPLVATGDGLAMALRARVPVADVEFFQFHPTALHHPAMPRPLLSEALRGHGAILRDANGERFVDELLPRDRVARAMTARMLEHAVDHLWLDATGLERFADRFPTIAEAVRKVGLDPARDWLPIAPAAHYVSGGVVTDLHGATALPGLWACGEVACTGVHGANRLASNSLLEGMVFAPRVVEAICAGRDGPQPTGAMRAVLDPPDGTEPLRLDLPSPPDPADFPSLEGAMAPPSDGKSPPEVLRDRLQRVMTIGAGVLRSAESLAATGQALGEVAAALPASGDVAVEEVRNLVTVGQALVVAASAREESRGAHTRTDFPEPSAAFRRRLVVA